MTDALWLDDPAAQDPAITGGKAAALSRLASEHRVPPGYVLTTAAFERAEAHGVEDLRSPVAEAYKALAALVGTDEPGVAVRSSAVDEDGAAASFAGQHETYLNVRGVDGVLDAIARCFESARAPRALEYRRLQGLDAERILLAVLIQHLVPADVSAVVFSANPVTSSRDEIVITASWGLGESVVGGTVTPDTYVVRRTDLAIVSREVADKRRMTVPVPGGTREVDVPTLLRSRPTLDDEHAAELASLALALERASGHPVDIETAYRDDELYLLQSRPITTLATPSSRGEHEQPRQAR